MIEVEDAASADGSAGGSLLNVVSGKAKGEISHTSAAQHEVAFSVPLVWKQMGR